MCTNCYLIQEFQSSWLTPFYWLSRMMAVVGKLCQLHLSRISSKSGYVKVWVWEGKQHFLVTQDASRRFFSAPLTPMALRFSCFYRVALWWAPTEGREVHTLRDAHSGAILLGRRNTDFLPWIYHTAPCETCEMPAPLLFCFLTFFYFARSLSSVWGWKEIKEKKVNLVIKFSCYANSG